LWSTVHVRTTGKSNKFFYRVIRSKDSEEIAQLIAGLGEQSQSILESVLDIVYYMRGGVTYTEAMFMSAAERTSATQMINKRLNEASENQAARIMI
jgi:hypothetical protein